MVGDRVELSSAGGERVLVGVIERVDPMRTIIRTDASLPVTIPNKVCAVCLATYHAAKASAEMKCCMPFDCSPLTTDMTYAVDQEAISMK